MELTPTFATTTSPPSVTVLCTIVELCLELLGECVCLKLLGECVKSEAYILAFIEDYSPMKTEIPKQNKENSLSQMVSISNPRSV